MGKLSELSVWGGRRASHNERGWGTGGGQGMLEDARRTSTEKKREGWDALGKMLLARLLNGSSYSGSYSRPSITHLHL